VPQTLAEVLYELGRAALEQQERQVGDLRTRTQALLAGTAFVASFFGATALDRGGVSAPVVFALAILSASILVYIYVLLPHRLQFVLDVHDVHRDLYDPLGEDIGAIQARVAYTFQEFRELNQPTVDRLFSAFAAGTALVVVQIVLWSWAIAIA
jgi:hypothetical protein